ncbi:hypothetical protein QTP88_019284 [Uroleucon formosanum]
MRCAGKDECRETCCERISSEKHLCVAGVGLRRGGKHQQQQQQQQQLGLGKRAGYKNTVRGGWWSQMYGGGVHTLWGEQITTGEREKNVRPVMFSRVHCARIPNIMLHSSLPAGDDDDATSSR